MASDAAPRELAPDIRARLLDKLGPDCAEAYPRFLEAQFPHVLVAIERLWGTPELTLYLNDLLITERTDRQGFPDAAVSDITALMSAYRRLGLVEEKPQGDVWDWVSTIDVGAFDKSRRS